MSEYEGLFLLHDIEGLYSKKLNTDCYTFNFIFLITNKNCFKEYCDSIVQYINQKSFVLKSDLVDNDENIYYTKSIKKEYQITALILDAYLSCDLYNRVFFIEKYHNLIDIRLLMLLQEDINTLLNINSQSYIISSQFNIDAFEKAKSKWLKHFKS